MDDELRERHDAWIHDREDVGGLLLSVTHEFMNISTEGRGSGHRRARTRNHDSSDKAEQCPQC